MRMPEWPREAILLEFRFRDIRLLLRWRLLLLLQKPPALL
jgi:hypothetical protein